MPYMANWIVNDRYVIEDTEYGHRLCELEFLDIANEISDEQKQDIADRLTAIVIEVKNAKTE